MPRLLNEATFSQARAIIDAGVRARRATGKTFPTDLSHALLLELVPVTEAKDAEGEDVYLTQSDGLVTLFRLIKSLKTLPYSEFWSRGLTWHGPKGVRRFLLNKGFTEPQISRELMGDVYDGVSYRVLSLISRPSDGHILVGLRSTGNSGEYGGTISLPGGLVYPGETLLQAATRLNRDELGNAIQVVPNPQRSAAVPHDETPSWTFTMDASAPPSGKASLVSMGGDKLERLDWIDKGILAWTPRRVLKRAVDDNDTGILASYLREHGLNFWQDLKFAGDFALPIRTLFSTHP